MIEARMRRGTYADGPTAPVPSQAVSLDRPTPSPSRRAVYPHSAQAGSGPIAVAVPVVTVVPGGIMVVLALLVPVMLFFVLFALDLYEDLLFPPSSSQHTEQDPSDANDPGE